MSESAWVFKDLRADLEKLDQALIRLENKLIKKNSAPSDINHS